MNLLEIGRGRLNHPACAHHRLSEESGDGLRPFRQDALFNIVGQAGSEILFALTRLGVAEIMGAIDMQDVMDRQVEITVVRDKAT